MTAKITIKDPDPFGIPLHKLRPGDFFCFHSEGEAFVVTEFVCDISGASLSKVHYRCLGNKTNWRRSTREVSVIVYQLKLVSAEFELEGTS